MKKTTIFLFFLLIVTGCQKFNTEEVLVKAYNASNDPVEFNVNNGPGYLLGPNSTGTFTVAIEIATRPVSSTAPSYTVDKIVQVSVSVKNLRSGSQLPHRMCSAGAKVIMHISYEVSSYGYESLRCDATYPNQTSAIEAEMKERGLVAK